MAPLKRREKNTKRIYFHIPTNHRIMVPEKPMLHWHGSLNKVLIGVWIEITHQWDLHLMYAGFLI